MAAKSKLVRAEHAEHRQRSRLFFASKSALVCPSTCGVNDTRDIRREAGAHRDVSVLPATRVRVCERENSSAASEFSPPNFVRQSCDSFMLLFISLCDPGTDNTCCVLRLTQFHSLNGTQTSYSAATQRGPMA